MPHLFHRYHGAPMKVPVAVPDPVSTFMPQVQKRHYGLFWLALTAGFGSMGGLTYETIEQHSRLIEACFVIVGSLFVPVLYVFYLDLRNHFVDPRWRVLVTTFLLGAVVSVPVAIVLELVLPAGVGKPEPSFITGLIEEMAKALAVLWLLRKGHRYLQFEMDGIIVGAAAGMGFAALEDVLYATSAFHHGLHSLVLTVWLRALLGPFGHGTWTAIVAGTIWAAKKDGHPRLTLSVIGAYLLAAGLHGLWDWNPAPDLWALLWMLGVGALGLIYLRHMIHHALMQEETFQGGGAQAVPVETS